MTMEAPRWGFPEMGVPQNGWFIWENPIEMDDLGVPLFQETTICGRKSRDFVFVGSIPKIDKLTIARAEKSAKLHWSRWSATGRLRP